MIDAEVLWTAGRREGALLCVLVAVSAAARIENPGMGDGAAFRAFLANRHTWNISVEHRSQQVSVDQLLWNGCDANSPTTLHYPSMSSSTTLTRTPRASTFVLAVLPTTACCCQRAGTGGYAGFSANG
jgi:hypothetical protein